MSWGQGPKSLNQTKDFPLLEGKELVLYRFQQGGESSPIRSLWMMIEMSESSEVGLTAALAMLRKRNATAKLTMIYKN